MFLSIRRALHGARVLNEGVPGLWDPYAATPISRPRELEGTTAAVHLSGANLAGRRWTASYKQEILESRVKPTHALATLLAGLRPKPAVLVCASAIGIYGGRGDELLTEASSPGSGFLPEVCLAWEKSNAAGLGRWDPGGASSFWRRAIAGRGRPGADAAGFSRRPGRPARQRPAMDELGGAAGCDSGHRVCTGDRCLAGPVNVVAPNPVTNLEFTRSLGRVLHRPTLLRVPAFALRLAFGEMAEATILESERVLPARLSASGFDFEYPELEAGLARSSALVVTTGGHGFRQSCGRQRMIYVGRA